MKKNADKGYEQTKPKQTQNKANQSQFQMQKMLLRLTINGRRSVRFLIAFR
ncbi:MAG: hypothetical protein ACYTBX_09940 [Planctomycetota bacterium]|jgi:hypothetical protein